MYAGRSTEWATILDEFRAWRTIVLMSHRSFLALLCCLAVGACSSPGTEKLNGGTGADGGDDGSGGFGDDGSLLDDGGFFLDDVNTDVPPPCSGLKCQQTACAGGGKTTVSGTVYDPAGKVPLYNVIVYVPNAPLEPFPGGATCDKCGVVTSGSPIATALTDAKGHFTIENVPVGNDIPIVYQVGKWRRKVVLPEVKGCQDNPITNHDQERLPRNSTEGDIPQFAVTTGGCDQLECFLRKVGVSDSEFTSSSGKGRVHLYQGGGGSTVSGITQAKDFWNDEAKLAKYDVTVLSCECSENAANKGATALAEMHKYIEAGGRVFASHYHYYWFERGAADFAGTANWGSLSVGNPYFIDTTFPKGKSFAEWLLAVGASTTSGQLSLSSVKSDVKTVNKSAQRWVYGNSAAGETDKYYSFNAPIAKPADQQCGRAVFSDIHVSNDTGGGAFPGLCGAVSDLTPQEKALEFLLFDLSSCIQDDGTPPAPPPPF